jgi:hypothetical protein
MTRSVWRSYRILRKLRDVPVKWMLLDAT